MLKRFKKWFKGDVDTTETKTYSPRYVWSTRQINVDSVNLNHGNQYVATVTKGDSGKYHFYTETYNSLEHHRDYDDLFTAKKMCKKHVRDANQ